MFDEKLGKAAHKFATEDGYSAPRPQDTSVFMLGLSVGFHGGAQWSREETICEVIAWLRSDHELVRAYQASCNGVAGLIERRFMPKDKQSQ